MSGPFRITHPPLRRKRRRKDTGVLLWLPISALVAAVEADNSQQQNQDQQEQESYPENHGLQTVARYCPKRMVEVTEVRVTCDSPGAYYYGSKTYRSSEVCIYGDKVNVNAQGKQPFSSYRTRMYN